MAQSCTLYISPPASGKTTFVLSLLEKRAKVIFLSPLRALANEFHERACHEVPALLASSKRDLARQFHFFEAMEHGLWVVTPELMGEEFWKRLSLQREKILVILDEFHLFYMWRTFRPILWEAVIDSASYGFSFFMMTATMTEKLLCWWKEDFSLAFDQLYLVDQGNNQFKNPPARIHYYPTWQKRSLFVKLNWAVMKKKRVLLFCQYRREVDWWKTYFIKEKVSCIGCVGGEVEEFRLELFKNPEPQVIVATKTLGHGVNLPSFDLVVFDHIVADYSWWLQMVARGGRRGEEFEILTMDTFDLTFMERLKQVLAHVFGSIFF